MLPRPLVTALTILISVAWAGNVVVGFLAPDRHDPMINAIFAIVVGTVYALGHQRSAKVREARRKLAELIAGEHGDADPDEQDSTHA
ncbi:hypothetical protein SAMN05421810_10167 [Amycolatopsis arida]|uniref:Uncharacterized protein n=1 Tax=Amycolatopsis arida TaxID=587909 RepID=A0A1I5KAP9_9PSEU|nr:hypothetical protein [Amycolatopsis arida]TDX96963.1 hypothetical protein CLV69_10265 [Amycolatopsis arida]SFO82087.1 hypothetical protein SAMN05421810_10167 [Amycolatopsis arida]